MLKENQLKELNFGTVLYINNYPVTFKSYNEEENVVFCNDDIALCSSDNSVRLTPDYLSVEKIKVRKFKEGDIVEVTTINGRFYPEHGAYLCGARCTVLEDEETESFIRVRHNATDYVIDPVYLKLITPVEDLQTFFLDTEEFCELPYYCIYYGTKNNQELVSRLDKKYYTEEDAYAEVERLVKNVRDK